MSKRNKYLMYMFIVRSIAYFYISFMLTHIFGHNVATIEYWALYIGVIVSGVVLESLVYRIGYCDAIDDCTTITIKTFDIFLKECDTDVNKEERCEDE